MLRGFTLILKMKTKTIAITTMVIFLMSFALACYPEETHAGETCIYPNEMGIENLVYTVIGNSSPIGDLDIQINSTNITITFPGDMKPDKFQLVFLEEQIKEVEKIVYRGGGGGTRTKYVDKNVTVYIPIYNNTIEEVIVEVEKIVDNTTVLETGYDLWMVLFAMSVGGVFIFSIMRKIKKKSVEEIVEEIGDGTKTD